jgi:hypothetical protein
MLRMALKIHWKQMINNVDLLGSILKPSVMIANRRMRMAVHIAWHDDLLANDLLFWDQQHRCNVPSKPQLTFIVMQKKDISLLSVHKTLLEIPLVEHDWQVPWGPG